MEISPLHRIQDERGIYCVADLDFPTAHIYSSIENFESSNEDDEKMEKIEYTHLFSISYERAFLGMAENEDNDTRKSYILLKLDRAVPSELIRQKAAIQKLQPESSRLRL
jgi:hypothetical protein